MRNEMAAKDSLIHSLTSEIEAQKAQIVSLSATVTEAEKAAKLAAEAAVVEQQSPSSQPNLDIDNEAINRAARKESELTTEIEILRRELEVGHV